MRFFMYEGKMYNENLKEEYILEKESQTIIAKNYLRRSFIKVSTMEEKLGKDLCDFTTEEILEYYKISNMSLGSLSCLNSNFSLYVQFCLERNLVKDNQNHFLEISIENFNQCVNKTLVHLKIVDKEMIYKWINELPNAKDAFVILGLFEGLKGKDFSELINLRKEDINGNELRLCTGRKIMVSNKLINVIQDCIEEDTYYSVTGKGEKVIKLVDDGYVIKNYPNTNKDVSNFQLGRRIYNGIQRSFDYLGSPYISANDIVTSGKIYMIKEIANKLGISNIELINSPYIKDVNNQFDFVMVKSIFIKQYKDYLI